MTAATFEPKAGMVINYGYLWARQAEQSLTEPQKYRPSLILAVQEENQQQMVYVSPMSHTPPFYPEDSMLMPPETKERLGLDGKNSWLMLSEVNKFAWPGPDLRRTPYRDGHRPFYGYVSAEFLEAARNQMSELVRLNRFKNVARDLTERHPEDPAYTPQPMPARRPVQAPVPIAG